MNKQAEPFTIVQLVAIDETGDSYYRMRWPAKELSEQAPNWRVLNLDARSEERFEWAEAADLLIVFQSHDIDLIPIIQKRRSLGLKTLAEYNDNFYAPPPATPVASAWSSPILWQTYERIMHECDGVLVTGEGLRTLFSTRTKTPIHILENNLPESPPPFEQLWQETDAVIRIGLAGSLGHFSDYMALRPVLQELVRRSPNIVVHLMGNESLPQILGLPEEKTRFTLWGPMEKYFDFWKPVHIGLAPLLDTPYNICRSDVKALEISSRAAFPLLSDSLPYRKFVAKTGVPVFSKFVEMLPIVERLIAKPAEIREGAKRCYDYSVNERIGKNRTERLDLYTSHLPSKPGNHHWRYPSGCHEVTGVTMDKSKESVTLAEVQTLLNEKKAAEAYSLLETQLSINPFYPALALAALRILLSASEAEWNRHYESSRKLFPSDLRFPLLLARRVKDPQALLRVWTELRSELENMPAAAKEFYAPMIVPLLSDQLVLVPLLRSIAAEFAKMYPEHARLRFALAQSAEQSGDIAEAAEHCRQLVSLRNAAAVNEKLFGELDLKYLRTWLASLEGREVAASKTSS